MQEILIPLTSQNVQLYLDFIGINFGDNCDPPNKDKLAFNKVIYVSRLLYYISTLESIG
jgi:hypothetical protein